MKINTAIMLAAGAGDRLKPLVNERPKVMVEIKKKQSLSWVIKPLKQDDATDLLVLSEKTLMVLKNETLREQLSENASNYSMQFDFTLNARTFESIKSCK
jgi:choline kinase